MGRPTHGVSSAPTARPAFGRVVLLLSVLLLTAGFHSGPQLDPGAHPLDAVIATLETALQRDGKDPDLWTTLGVAFVARGLPEAAEKALLTALGIKPDHFGA
ncbi:MAG: hypothetical protein HYV61_00255, partial [Candidatus Rokubacteria bacterium]|nr:hypothetical protein [Candidatus Rokubacteria bacterium]